ncbi:signal transduction histidine kinase/DNA-binding response OmpR family regulator [Catenulispora sp. MAP5-51]|uniref:SpoIIE family protein phosphatase n=1 Tax=Catenulispora sp. MAP5-51 TaxID=3156298 RepID=UPI00351702A8
MRTADPSRERFGAELAAAIDHGGQMGKQFAGYDWAGHSLGEPSAWPPQWRTAVATALTSKFPIVVWLGPQLHLVYNDAYVPMLGEKHPAALGETGEAVWWDIWPTVGPMLAGVMDTGEATWSADLMLALVADGRPWERYFTFGYNPIMGQTGEPCGVFCAVTETTERVLSERRMRLLSDMDGQLLPTRTAQQVVDAAGRVCDGNHPDVPFLAVYTDTGEGDGDARLTGATESVRDLLPPAVHTLLPEHGLPPGAVHELDVGHGPRSPRAHASTALLIPLPGQNTEDYLLLGLNPHRPLDSQYREFCRLLSDQIAAALTAARSFEGEHERANALAQLDAAKTVFLTNTSHEFRTPLTLVLGPLEDTLATETDPERRETLETALRNAARLERLVDSLLQFARTEAGRARPQPVALDLGALTAQIASSFTELCARAGLELVIDCAPTPAEVDPEMWETIVLNLLSNAVKFTPAGRIGVRARRRPDGGVEVTVADTGVGIAPHDQKHLFERFYRADNSRTRSVEGSGIGLSLVRSLVELHGGTIGVDSTLDEGTSVRIELPAAADQDLAIPSHPVPVLPARHTDAFLAEASSWIDVAPGRRPRDAGERRELRDRPTVLIADDNADMRRHLERICAAHWNVETVGDGRAALARLRARRPDVLVTDVMMPALDGLGLVAAIRDDPKLRNLPVIILSARAGMEEAGTGLAAGADDYLPKPFRSTDLVNRIAARLHAAGRERDRHRRQQARTRRAALLGDLSAAVSAAASTRDILTALLTSPAALGATTACLGILDTQRAALRLTHAEADGADSDGEDTVELSGGGLLARVARTGESIVVEDTESDPRFPTALEGPDFGPDRDRSHDSDSGPGPDPGLLRARAAILHPVRDTRGIVVGVLALSWPDPRAFTVEDRDLALAAAAAIGRALERTDIAEREHLIAIGMQEHHLDLDRRSGAAVLAARYEPAAELMHVGGDWYLAASPPRGDQVAVSVGDAVGHGLASATVMSRLRSAAAAATLTDPDPRQVMHQLDSYAASMPDATCTTVSYALLDARTGTLDYACAGHPYPLLVTEDGTTRYLTDGRRPPLAVGATGSVRPGRDHLPPGALLLLYTDGLIERRGEDLEAGFDRLAEAAATAARLPAEQACGYLLSALAPPDGFHDDVAVLALRPVGTTSTSLVATHPADPATLPGLRDRIRSWLESQELDPATAHNILVCTGEALASAVEHGAHAKPRQHISLEMFADADLIRTTVTEPGHWTSQTQPDQDVPAASLTLIRGLSDHARIDRGPRGTCYTMHHCRTPVTEPQAASATASPHRQTG